MAHGKSKQPGSKEAIKKHRHGGYVRTEGKFLARIKEKIDGIFQWRTEVMGGGNVSNNPNRRAITAECKRLGITRKQFKKRGLHKSLSTTDVES